MSHVRAPLGMQLLSDMSETAREVMQNADNVQNKRRMAPCTARITEDERETVRNGQCEELDGFFFLVLTLCALMC